jgi:uncharacterized GH25 family protein
MHRPAILAVALLAALAAAAVLDAHEVKAFASHQAMAEAGGKTTVYLSWGHKIPVDDLLDAETLERYDLVPPSGPATALKASGKGLHANTVVLKDAGVWQVAVARKPSVFTYVLDDEGKRQMKRGPKSAQAGARVDSATRSVQCAKALLVAGAPGDKAPEAVGMPIELIPLDAPEKWAASSTLRFRLLVNGKPEASAEVVARPVGFRPESAWCYATTTGRGGEFTIKPGQAGTWLIKAQVKKLAQGKAREEYDFDSYTATLSVEVAP